MQFQILIAFLSFKFICKSTEFMVKEGSKRRVFDEKENKEKRKEFTITVSLNTLNTMP